METLEVLTFYDRMYTDLVKEKYGDKTNNAP